MAPVLPGLLRAAILAMVALAPSRVMAVRGAMSQNLSPRRARLGAGAGGHFPLLSFDAAQEEMFLRNAGAASVYFEFGSGGSTRAVLDRTKVPKVYAVDSVQEWLDKVSGGGYYGSRLTTIFANIGRVGAFGSPVDEERREFWPAEYSGRISAHPEADVVLVDGRFRVACVASTLLHTRPGTVIMIHDFRGRPSYHIILELVDVLEETGALLVFRAKKGLPRAAAQLLYDEYKYDYDIHDRQSKEELEELRGKLRASAPPP